jgi:hypothetical protein
MLNYSHLFVSGFKSFTTTVRNAALPLPSSLITLSLENQSLVQNQHRNNPSSSERLTQQWPMTTNVELRNDPDSIRQFEQDERRILVHAHPDSIGDLGHRKPRQLHAMDEAEALWVARC